MRAAAACAACAVVVTMTTCKAVPAGKPLAFQTVASGIDHATFDVAGEFSGHAFDVDLVKADVHVVSAGDARHTVDLIASAFPIHVATNASFFDDKNVAMGRVVDGSKVLSADKRSPWGALVIEGTSAKIVLGDALPSDKPGGDVVVQGIPRLVVAGEVTKLKQASAERTAVRAAGSKITIVVSTAAESSAFAHFLALPRAKGGLGCVDALNLDGGPSTQLDASLSPSFK